MAQTIVRATKNKQLRNVKILISPRKRIRKSEQQQKTININRSAKVHAIRRFVSILTTYLAAVVLGPGGVVEAQEEASVEDLRVREGE